MWVKRAEWEQLVREAAQTKLLYKFLDDEKASSSLLEEACKNYRGRIKELEAGILDLQDKLNQASRAVVPPSSVDLSLMLDEEDPELVRLDRLRAQAEGSTDGLLAEME